MTPSNQDLERILKDVYSAVVGAELVPADQAAPMVPKESRIMASVSFTGSWQGALCMEYPSSLARDLAATMFDTKAETVSRDELHDAVGEIANIAGGNFKTLVGGGCQISLPSVTEGTDYEQVVSGAKVALSGSFGCQGRLLTVRILEKA
ncbi:MAG TPA: chemotaxis protein CheX [bacterium]|jgi:chemotaxis protein CheX|nr:chemotaxis protein CheX [bacterium]